MLTREFIEKFMELKNKSANLQIKHILYGDQQINKCVLHPFVDDGHIGFIIEDEERYVVVDELIGVSINENECCIRSVTMEFFIQV